ncbi:MAG TPA: beta-propeller fold lactonase family protein, partial [Burkholderiales bacterium]|nr:beta-propeller fold lactonase family protein [Burkholderiales bacterium]
NLRPRQMASAIHVHPNGRFVYVANRADHKIDVAGSAVFGGGENSLVVYAIDQRTGEPRFVQRIDPRAYHVRTFAIDPGSRMLVAASIKPMPVREGSKIVIVPAGLSVFRMGDDGKLEFARKYDVDTGNGEQWWMGII